MFFFIWNILQTLIAYVCVLVAVERRMFWTGYRTPGVVKTPMLHVLGRKMIFMGSGTFKNSLQTNRARL